MVIKQVGTGLSGQLGYASAISVVLFFLTLIPLTVIGWANNKDLQSGRRTRRGQSRTHQTAAIQNATKETMA